MNVVATSVLLAFSVAKICASNPTGSAGSVMALRPEKVMVGLGIALTVLHAPKLLAAGPVQLPSSARCSESPCGSVPASRTPMSLDSVPEAGPFVAVKVPSYDRNSTTELPLTSANPSGSPFWMPFTG